MARADTTATSAQLALTFNPAPVGVLHTPAQALTASFTVSGSVANLTASVHYGTDFTAGAVECASGGSCTVDVTFAPTLPGARRDALFLMNGADTLATVYLGGVGQAPQALVQPGVVTQLVTGSAVTINKSAVDENGIVYWVEQDGTPGNNVFSVTPAGVMSLVPVNAGHPQGITIDGAGILYITEGGQTLATWNTVTQTAGTLTPNLPSFYVCSNQEDYRGVAVDISGNLFLTEIECQAIVQVRPNGTTVNNLMEPPIANAFWIAVDGARNSFYSGTGEINEMLANGNQIELTNPGDPLNSNLEVDAADTLYVSPRAGGGVVELPASNYEAPQASLDPIAIVGGTGLGSDGTLYVGNAGTSPPVGSGNLDRVDRSQGAIGFGQQVVGTASAPQQVAMYNGGNQALTIFEVALTDSGSGYALQPAGPDDCSNGQVLAQGSYCQVTVSLTPAHVGNLTGSILFSTNSLNDANSVETVALSGFVPGSYATLSPSPVVFAEQAPNTTSTASAVTLTNTGTVALTGIVASLTGIDPSNFALTAGANACGTSLAAGSSCSIYVTFTPTVPGNYFGTISVADGAINSPQTAALSGASVAPPAILQVDESVHTTDTPEAGESMTLKIAEILHVSDTPLGGLAASLTIAEIIQSSDAIPAPPTTTSAALNIAEVIQAADGDSLPTIASASLNIAEMIHTTDGDTVTILVVPTQTSLSSSTNPSLAGKSVTFTATVSSLSPSGGTPTGAVQFMMNGTAAGAPAPISGSGQAVYSTSTLPVGQSSISASYSGDINFEESTAAAVVQSVLSFHLLPATSSATVSPGQSATFQFTIAPQGAFEKPITFSVSGLPPGATASFTPSSLTPPSGATTVVLAIKTVSISAADSTLRPLLPVSPLMLGILLPLIGLRRMSRRAFHRRGTLLTVVATLGITAMVSGCGGGHFTQPSQTYPIVVTATSGSLQTSTTVYLVVR